jgi:hypothetical protein
VEYRTEIVLYFSFVIELTRLIGRASLPPSIIVGIQIRDRRQVQGKDENEEPYGVSGNQNGGNSQREKRAAYRKKSHRQNSIATSLSTGQPDSAEASGSHENGISHGNSSRGHRGRREAAGKLFVRC